MSDHDAVTALLARYCHIVDEAPAETIADMFWDDATLDFDGVFTGRAHIVEAYAGWIAKMRDPVDQLRHLIYPPMIDIDGDRATAATYFDADAVTRRSRRRIYLRGIYRDVLEKRGGEWRFARREIVSYSDD